MSEQKLRTIPISRIATRSNLFLGGDRELVMFSAVISAVMVFTMYEWLAAIFGVIFWLCALFIFRQMAKSDPYMRHIWVRYIKNYRQDYYPPRSTPFCKK